LDTGLAAPAGLAVLAVRPQALLFKTDAPRRRTGQPAFSPGFSQVVLSFYTCFKRFHPVAKPESGSLQELYKPLSACLPQPAQSLINL
jgi:hypothetical protein